MNRNLERLQVLMNEISKWSDTTFDYGKFDRKRALPISYHLQKETQELTKALHDYHENCKNITLFENLKEELADCFMLILDCATHSGCNADELVTSCFNKLEINKIRIWGEPNIYGFTEHIELNNK